MESKKELNIIEASQMPVGTEFKIIQKFWGKNTNIVEVVRCGAQRALKWKGCDDFLETNENNILAKFIPMDKQVDFIEAVKAKKEGRTVYCILRNVIYTYKSENGLGMVDETGTAVAANEILHGEWFIKTED